MMPPELLVTLRTRGLEITAAGDRLRIRPVGLLTDTDRALLLAMKPALLVLLEQERLAVPVFTTGPWQSCLRCDGRRWWHDGVAGDRCLTCEPRGLA
jgi:TubC N-terminal docking domain